jgi:hypothetical protein
MRLLRTLNFSIRLDSCSFFSSTSSRKLLSQALLDLILEKGYERVTVQNILDRANVGRSTWPAPRKLGRNEVESVA